MTSNLPANFGRRSRLSCRARADLATYSRWIAEPAEVLARLAAELVAVLGDDLLSLALHGSWALGDFAPGRSDLDMLAVMATDPNAGRSRFPEWSALIDWAQDWWYHGGSDSDHGPLEDVRRFVNDVSARLLRHYDIWPHSGLDSPSPDYEP